MENIYALHPEIEIYRISQRQYELNTAKKNKYVFIQRYFFTSYQS